jgi:putative membrane protein
MKRALLSVMCALLAMAYIALAQPPQSGQPTQPTQPQAGYPPNAGANPGSMRNDPTMGNPGNAAMPPKIDDKTFLKHAAIADVTEIELGKLAANKSSNQAVREFANKMVNERQQANEELQKLASKQGVEVVNALDSKHKGKVDKLAKLDGAAFDKAFLKDQVRQHRDDVADYQAEVQGGSDPSVKNFANRILPMVQADAQQAKNLEEAKNSPSEEPHR